jgi:hypothetical protein
MRFLGRSLIILIGLLLVPLAVMGSLAAQEDRFDAATGPILIGAISDKLREFGFYQGPHVESVTPALGKAIAAYRAQTALPAGSFADQELINRLNFGSPVKALARPDARPASLPAISPLHQAQKRLSELGYYTAKIDGLNGPAMQEAVRQFQGQHDMAIDGAVTPALIEKLNAAK